MVCEKDIIHNSNIYELGAGGNGGLNKIVFGCAVSLTGKFSSNGVHTVNGYNLAINEINKRGGVTINGKKYKFDIKYYDDESNPNIAALLAEKLILKDQVNFMLGPYSSGLTKAIARITERYKIPMVEANGASGSLFTKGYKYLFAVLTPAYKYLTVAIETAYELNKKKPLRVAMAFEQDSFSQDVRLGVLREVQKTGSSIIIDDKLPKQLNDMKETLRKVKKLSPDILIVSGHTKGALTAIRQIKELKVNVPMLAMTHCDAAKLSKQHGNNAEYVLCASQWHKSLIGENYKDNIFYNGRIYEVLFKSKYGYDPPYQSAESSAALLVFKDAFERANSLDKEKVRDALENTDLVTFYGPIKFSKGMYRGANIAKPMVLFQVSCNRNKCSNKVVAPLNSAPDKIIYPMPEKYK